MLAHTSQPLKKDMSDIDFKLENMQKYNLWRWLKQKHKTQIHILLIILKMCLCFLYQYFDKKGESS